MKRVLRIGTRDSRLAIWQAEYIEKLLQAAGIQTQIVHIKSDGEADLVSPLYEMGVQGIFTKTLDIALIQNKIDLAVHSLKDVPTQPAEGLCIAAIPKRASWQDVLVYKDANRLPENTEHYNLATSSLRRRAQWLNRFPLHSTEPIRGNINTRLEKLINNAGWDGVLFAAAGLERIGLQVPHITTLDWMLPAPGQGALAVVCREDDMEIHEACVALNDEETMHCTLAERQFLRTLMGGCTMPIAAYASMNHGNMVFKGNVLTVDGCKKAEVEKIFAADEMSDAGKIAAEMLLKNGGEEIVKTFRTTETN